MNNTKKEIKNMTEMCTSECCTWRNKFPYCSKMCNNIKYVIEYEDGVEEYSFIF